MSLGTLYVDLQADTGKFVSALNQAAAATKDASRKMSGDLESFQKSAAKSLDTSELSRNMQAIRRASAELNASIATGSASSSSQLSARRNIVDLAKQEISLVEQKGTKDAINLGYLRAATAEIEKQKTALGGTGISNQILNAIKLRVTNIPGLGGIGGAMAMRAYEPVGKEMEEGAGALEEKFGGAAVAISEVGAAVIALGVVAGEVTHHMMDLAQSVENTAAATGLTTRQVQELSEISKETGIDEGSLEQAFSRVTSQLGEYVDLGGKASSTSGVFVRAMQQLGVATTDAAGHARHTNDVLADFYDVLQKIPDPSERAQVELGALGTRGRAIAEMFEEARREGLSYRDMLASIDESGNVIPDSELDQLEKAKGKWDELTRAVRGFATEVQGGLASSLISLKGFGLASFAAGAAGPVGWFEAMKAFNSAGPSAPEASGGVANIAQLGELNEGNEQLREKNAVKRAGGETQFELLDAEEKLAVAEHSHNEDAIKGWQTRIALLKEAIALDAGRSQHAAKEPKDTEFDTAAKDAGKYATRLKELQAGGDTQIDRDKVDLQQKQADLTAAKARGDERIASLYSTEIRYLQQIIALEGEGNETLDAAAGPDFKSAAEAAGKYAEKIAELKAGSEENLGLETARAGIGKAIADQNGTMVALYQLQIGELQEMLKLDEQRKAEQAAQEQQKKITEGVAKYSVGSPKEMGDLGQIREQLEATGQSTLLVDAAIAKTGDESAQKWNEAALSVGTFEQKMRAVANEIETEGQNASTRFADQWKTSFDSLSGDLARFVITGKNTMGQFLQGIAEQTLTNTFKTAFSKIFTLAFGGPHAVGPGGGAPGSGGTGSTLPGPLAAIGSFFGVGGKSSNPMGMAASFFGLGKGNGAPTGTASDPLYVTFSGLGGASLAGALPGGSSIPGVGGIFSSFPGFASLLPGFAEGGRPSYGEPSIVGERGPELFVPDRTGSIYPGVPAGYRAHSGGGDTHYHNSVTMNIETDNADTFRKSSAQLHAEAWEQMAQSSRRNG